MGGQLDTAARDGGRGRIDPEVLADLRARADLVGLAAAVVPLRRAGGVHVGPCPFCGGSKRSVRFEVRPAQRVWVCAVCQDGGDAIAFVMRAEGLGFRAAVERLGGARPLDDAARARLAAEAARHDREAAKRAAAAAGKARAIWDASVPAEGTPVEAYLRGARKIPVDALPGGAIPRALRCHPALDYWVTSVAARPEVIHRGPAMVAPILGPGRAFLGAHITWLAAGGSGKLALPPKNGEELPAKKVKGAQKGGSIRLSAPAPVLLLGEGVETVLTVLAAVSKWPGHSSVSPDAVPTIDGRRVAAWSGVSLGNLAGRAHGRGARHPEKPDLWVPDNEPDPDEPGMMPPDWAEEVVLLGDGDSDPLVTRARLECAAARYVAAGKRVRIAWADPGKDFNDMVRG